VLLNSGYSAIAWRILNKLLLFHGTLFSKKYCEVPAIAALLLCCIVEFEQPDICRNLQLTALLLEDLKWGANHRFPKIVKHNIVVFTSNSSIWRI